VDALGLGDEVPEGVELRRLLRSEPRLAGLSERMSGAPDPVALMT
jgi:hypothetical protein